MKSGCRLNRLKVSSTTMPPSVLAKTHPPFSLAWSGWVTRTTNRCLPAWSKASVWALSTPTPPSISSSFPWSLTLRAPTLHGTLRAFPTPVSTTPSGRIHPISTSCPPAGWCRPRTNRAFLGSCSISTSNSAGTGPMRRWVMLRSSTRNWAAKTRPASCSWSTPSALRTT